MSKIMSTAIIAGFLFAISAPAFAADAPKTKADVRKDDDHEVGCQGQRLREEVRRVVRP